MPLVDIDAEQDARLTALESRPSPLPAALRSLGAAILDALTEAVRGTGAAWAIRIGVVLTGLVAGLLSGLVHPGEPMPEVVSAVLGIGPVPPAVDDIGDEPDTSAP